MFFLVPLLISVAATADVEVEQHTRFPRVYLLDEYESCLARPAGLYCLGTLRLVPRARRDPLYDAIQEYSRDPHHFNRTELHRGYCMNTRCHDLEPERNISLRFERCAAQWARQHSLQTELVKLRYCRSHAQEYARVNNPEPYDLPEKVLLFVLTTLILLNTIGTAHDVFTEDEIKKNPFLLIWSVRRNWKRLTASHDDGDQRLCALRSIQGFRVLILVLILAVHSGCIHVMLFLDNPGWVEQMSRNPMLMIFLNGTSTVQLFVTLSSFLLAYNLLLFSKKNVLHFKMLPLIIIKRIARISPLYLLVVGYAATLWRRAGAGPMWPLTVEAESEVCRDKFWTHLFFINNLINPENICLVQTWFLAVDMQLYVVAVVLCLSLSRLRRLALPILAALVLASAGLNGVLAHIYKWRSLLYYSYPQALSTMYRGVSSFSRYYQAPWASLPGCLIGLFAAFLHFELQETGVQLASYKWLKVAYQLAPVTMIAWIMCGVWVRRLTADWFVAFYVAVERPVPSALWALIILGVVNGMEGWLARAASWRGWRLGARCSLALLAVHWCVSLALAAHASAPLPASARAVVMNFLATTCLSYLLAIPLTVMVEIPAQKFINTLIFENKLSTPVKISPHESNCDIKRE